MLKKLSVLLSKDFKRSIRPLLPKQFYQLLNEKIETYYLISYPKSGRTWLRVLLGKFLIEYYGLDESLNPVDISTFWRLNNDVPKLAVSHGGKVAWQKPEEIRLPETIKDKKLILVIRDPRDIIVSLYHHMVHRHKSFTGSLADFLYQDSGSIDTIIKYYNSFFSGDYNFKDILIVKYEDLRRDPKTELYRIINFLKIRYTENGSIDKAIEYSTFDKMKEREAQSSIAKSGFDPLKPVDLENENSFKTRKGLVKGYEKEFNSEQLLYLEEKMKDLNLIYGY